MGGGIGREAVNGRAVLGGGGTTVVMIKIQITNWAQLYIGGVSCPCFPP